MESIKVVHIIPEIKIGGAERLVLDICKELNKNPNIEIKLITTKEKSSKEFLPYEINIPSYFIPSIRSKNKIKIDELQQFIFEFKPDIIHSHLWEIEILLTQVNTNGSHRVSHFHDNMIQLKKNIIPKNKIEITNKFEKKIFLKNSNNSFVCISNDTYNYAKKVLPKNSRIFLLPNAIDYNNFFCKEKRNLDKLRIINIGSFIPKKNQRFAILILNALLKKGIKCDLTFLGDGPEIRNCKDLANKLEISKNINFIGETINVNQYLNEANVYLHTALYEPFGLVLLEAMASGLPVISLDGKGNRDFINNRENGFIVCNQDINKFINLFLELVNDRSFYYMVSKNGQKTAYKYDIKNYSKKLINNYKEINLSANSL